MPHAVYENEVKKEGMHIVPGMDHTHSKGQKSCLICVENSKDAVANQMYRYFKNAAKILELNIMVALIKMFEPAPNKTKQSPSLKDEQTRNHTRGKHRKT